MIRYSLTLLFLLFYVLLLADDKPAAGQNTESKPEASAERRSGREPEIHKTGEQISGMVEYPPGSGKFYPRRQRGGDRPSRTAVPQGLFPTGKTEVAKSEETQLGGTVPALWEIRPFSPSQEDDELPPVMEMDSIAPVVPAKVIRFSLWFLQQHDTNNNGILEKNEWKSLPGAPQAIDIDGDGITTEEELVRYIGLYGKNRTIHNPNPVETYYYPRMISSQFQIFKPVTTADLPPQKSAETAEKTDGGQEQAGDDKDKKVADTKSDITEKVLTENDADVDDATYEEIVSGKLHPASKIYHTPKEELYGVPAWFILRDKDGDGQVSMTEFAPTLSAASLALFGRLDKDGDGFIVPDEIRKPKPLTIPATPIPPDEALPETPSTEPKPEGTPETPAAEGTPEPKPEESKPAETVNPPS